MSACSIGGAGEDSGKLNRNTVNWKGNFNAVVTPFTRDGDLDEDAFAENVRLLISEGLDGVVVTGCTGEFWSMSFDERLRCYELALEVADSEAWVIAGTSNIRTSEVIELSHAAKEAGVDGVMITPPAYVKPSFEEVRQYFLDISSAVQHPILMYNVPGRQGYNLTPRQIAQLGRETECIVAVKQSSPSFIEQIKTIDLASSEIRVFVGGSATRGGPGVLMGADGYVSSVEPQVLGERAIRLYTLASEGRIDEVRDIQYLSMALDEVLHGDGVGTFPASLKAAMNMLGRPGGYPREPLQALNDDELTELRNILSELDVL